ncbi:hypothetical protein AA101099_1408 [Neoasaia chiangmaiensis NBRC 101099]|uniref:restriction endonuclease n=1 Tax=Neoasaia chiangmaiensis TaxID=320497 RepID=UPI001191E2AA|nr:restriction endonuclease [Neoasaia chiangmaiensis]GBR38867.1 hypothetical protein AA101099_1408 [Neoasaia chiangmaiensis NBRC 101099]GEN15674.1 hypothetical protein NCH01_21050 [Neoasaia chiangmaiensis]
MAKHPDWDKLEKLMPAVREFQALASEHGIDDVFQDNGGKILQMLLALNLQGIPGREGNDAVDIEGREYELKSVNIHLTAGFSTNHHVNIPIIEKYRQAQWVFAVYEGIEMRRAFAVATEKLEAHFSKWEKQRTETGKDINNPKIPLNFVCNNGETLYDDGRPLDLKAAAAIRRERTKESANRRKAKAEAVADLRGDPAVGDNPVAVVRRREKRQTR